MKHRVNQIPFHPIFVAAYPVLALLAVNLGEADIRDGLRPLLLSLLGASVLLGLLWLLLRNVHRAALLCAMGVLLYFSYGHVYSALERVQLFGGPLGRHRYLLPLWLILFSGALYWLWARKPQLLKWTPVINALTTLLILIPLLQIVGFQRSQSIARSRQDARAESKMLGSGHEDRTLRDIYYIILDGYTSQEALKAYFLYDNSAFINDLKSMGFYVADGSQSNYAWTQMSLGSSLNMEYVQDLAPSFSDPDGGAHRTDLNSYILHSDVLRGLEQVGYKVVAFETGFQPTDWRHADMYFPAEDPPVERWQSWGRINAFEAMLIQTSMGLILTDSAKLLPQILVPDVSYPYLEHRERILSILRNLEQVPLLDGPKFVFAHILVPHSPMVFGPNGEFMYPDEPFTLQSDLAAVEEFKYQEKIQGYRHQVTFISREINQVVQTILERSSIEPIIILQGDHGGPLRGIPIEARMMILNAYYLPGDGEGLVYPTISPVNTFRMIFNNYLGDEYPLLDDVAYFSPIEARFQFEYVPNSYGGN